MKTKCALAGLLNPEAQQKDEESLTDDDEDDDDPKTQPSDAASLETDKKDGEEATAAQLDKERELVDARQTVNKETKLEKKEQKKASAHC